MKRYVSNKDETVRMFKQDWMEFFTHIHPSVPVIIYVPVIAFFLYRTAFVNPVSVGYALLLCLAGMFAWTLTEYILHRFAFHYQPTSNWGKSLHFIFHGVHHDYPRDSKRLVMAPVVSIPLAIVFYAGFQQLLGEVYVAPFFAGFIFGYLCYDMIHYATHHFSIKSRFGLWLKHHHMLHHYQDEDKRYGVSTPLWDYVFGTIPGAEKQQRAMTPGTEKAA